MRMFQVFPNALRKSIDILHPNLFHDHVCERDSLPHDLLHPDHLIPSLREKRFCREGGLRDNVPLNGGLQLVAKRRRNPTPQKPRVDVQTVKIARRRHVPEPHDTSPLFRHHREMFPERAILRREIHPPRRPRIQLRLRVIPRIDRMDRVVEEFRQRLAVRGTITPNPHIPPSAKSHAAMAPLYHVRASHEKIRDSLATCYNVAQKGFSRCALYPCC